jgi:uncharacterized membrane protein YjjB (DUF3815 family)
MASITADATTAQATDTIRRTGWFLITPLVAFIMVLGYVIIGGADHFNETTAAAEAAGTSVNTLPATEQARIAREHATYWVISGILLIVPVAIFTLALRAVRETFTTAATRQLTGIAWTLGVVTLVLWIAFGVLSLGLLADPDNLPVLVRDMDAIFVPGVTLVAGIALAAVICAALAVRRAGATPRIALVSAGIAGLLIVIGIVALVASGGEAGLIPIVPMVPTALLGIGLVRSTRKHAAA